MAAEPQRFLGATCHGWELRANGKVFLGKPSDGGGLLGQSLCARVSESRRAKQAGAIAHDVTVHLRNVFAPEAAVSGAVQSEEFQRVGFSRLFSLFLPPQPLVPGHRGSLNPLGLSKKVRRAKAT